MTDDIPFDPDAEAGSDAPEEIFVQTFSGYMQPVRDQYERAFYENLRDAYKKAYTFTDPSDMLDVDQAILMELTIMRTNNAIARNIGPSGDPLAPAEVTSAHRVLRDTRAALTKLKAELGISRTARNDGTEDDVATYIQTLLRSAKQFGMHRVGQVNLTIALLQQVISVARTWQNSDAFERSKTDYQTAEDVINFILSAEIAGKLEEYDAEFRRNKQRLWIDKL